MNITITCDSIEELKELGAFLNSGALKASQTNNILQLAHTVAEKWPSLDNFKEPEAIAAVPREKYQRYDQAIRDKVEAELYRCLREKKDIWQRDFVNKYSDVIQNNVTQMWLKRWVSQPLIAPSYERHSVPRDPSERAGVPNVVYRHTGIIRLPNTSKPIKTFPPKGASAKRKWVPLEEAIEELEQG